MGKYPVIFLSLKGIDGLSLEAAKYRLTELMGVEAERFAFLADSEKLTEILTANDVKSVTIVRMEVPCCGGLEHAAVTALKNSGKFIPWQVVTISIDGKILD